MRDSVAPSRVVQIALAVMLIASTATAQTEYTIGVGDVLAVRVWQREDLGGQVTVDYDGTINLPLVGTVRASDQTPAGLGEDLTRRYSFVDRQVSQVSVTVEQYKSRRVYVMGQVGKPGTYSYPEIPTLWDVIREAGGPAAGAALTRVQVIPPEGEGPPIIADVDRALSTGDFSQLPALKSGSTILVARKEGEGPEGDFVYVYGNVRKPGLIPFDTATNVLGAVLAAGGPGQGANMSKVHVVRPGPVQARVFEVNLEDYLDDGVLFPNFSLKPGDTVSVPRNETMIVFQVFGAVGRVVGQVFLIDRLFGDNRRNRN